MNSLKACPDCQRRRVLIRSDRREVARLARLAARSQASWDRYADELARAKAQVARSEDVLGELLAKCCGGES